MTRAKKIYLLTLTTALLVASNVAAQVKPLAVEKLDSSMRAEAKSVLILLSTDWCQYCQLQQNLLRSNRELSSALNNIYYIKFDAETGKSLDFGGKTYHYKPNGMATGLHELVTTLNDGDEISFPAWVALNENYQVVFRYNGVLYPGELKELIHSLTTVTSAKEKPNPIESSLTTGYPN
ncbi:MAG: hypothetical protein KIT80_10675 [Chitinophagaceae bacterium]|nr:hypothetical protein [Chitinophagaceae bacterium]MCW5927366.1 hypothetical protein [Chitinophagaceae bacterium]